MFVLVVDSWGKIPSALLDGNLYELGGFEECLNIQWNDGLYESKYCLGALKIDRKMLQVSHKNINLKNGIFPNIWLLNDNDEQSIETRALM